MILDHEGDFPSRWSAVVSVSDKIGCAPQTLHEWVKKAEVDSGNRAGVPTDTADKLKALERENGELRQANEVLRKPVLSLSGGRGDSPAGTWRKFEAVESATLESVDWFNHRRLLEPIGNIPPAEAEQGCYAMLDDIPMAA